MANPRRIIAVLMLVLLAVSFCEAQNKSDQSITVVFKDGHQKTLADVSRIEFKSGTMVVNSGAREERIPAADVLRMEIGSLAGKSLPLGRNHFVGKWEFGEGGGTRDTFFVTLDPDGQAHKTLGASHGTWVVADGEARISWDDGWHDVIRQVGSKHEKFAYEPGKPITGDPSNVAEAKSLNGQTM